MFRKRDNYGSAVHYPFPFTRPKSCKPNVNEKCSSGALDTKKDPNEKKDNKLFFSSYSSSFDSLCIGGRHIVFVVKRERTSERKVFYRVRVRGFLDCLVEGLTY